MNWQRGLVRIALLVAFVWAFQALATLWSPDGCRLIESDGTWCKYAFMLRIVESFYLPPVSLLLLVLALWWVVRGFRAIDGGLSTPTKSTQPRSWRSAPSRYRSSPRRT